MKNKIKIMHLTTDSQAGGVEKMISLFIRNSSAGFIHSLVVLKGPGPLSEEMGVLNVPALTLGITRPWHLWKFWKLCRIIRKEQPAILQCYLFHANIAGRIAGKLCGIRHIISGQRNIDPWRKWYHTLIDRITAPLAQAVISNTRAGKDRLVEIEKIPEKKITVIPNCVEAPVIPGSFRRSEVRKILGIPEDAFVILNIGSLAKKKGQEALINAFLIIADRYKKSHLVICGSGPLRDTLLGKIMSSLYSQRIHLLDFRKNILELYLAADLFVLSSLWEGMPNVVLEAMAAGLPVLATNTGGIPEMIEDKKNGFIAPAATAEAVSEKLSFILENTHLLPAVGEKAVETVKEGFSVQKMVRSLENFYRAAAVV
jgi:glycosyltransferase involved in cell wall biosynthesis